MATPSQPPPVPSSVALISPTADPTVRSAFAGEAEKLRDELREHNVPFTETDVAAIIVIGEEAVARNVPDLRADDPAITERVDQTFPHYTRQQRKDVVRCVAEQTEQVIARQSGDGVPPDQGTHRRLYVAQLRFVTGMRGVLVVAGACSVLVASPPLRTGPVPELGP